MRLKLGREWELGNRIDGGGFGQVYVAKSADNDDVVAKMVPKAPGGQRELLFVKLDGVRNIVPIIDSGETDNHWVLIMPRAKKSLRHYLNEVGGPVRASDAVLILLDITTALSDLEGKVVHRDLKPENILLFNDRWCLADFGISRYAESTTAPDTQKFALSPAYAAPERWRGERATTAADVYSFGVIAFELLAGILPFAGSEVHQLRDQHLHGEPPSLANAAISLQGLVSECLYKAAGARPNPHNILTRLSRIGSDSISPGVARLRDADVAEVARRSESARRSSQLRTEVERRKALTEGAITSLKQISQAVAGLIVREASSVSVREDRYSGWSAQLGNARLDFRPPSATPEQPWGSWEPPKIDVIAHASLSLQIPPDRFEYYGRSHSLWYCDAQEAGRYLWFETAFMVSPLIPKRGRQNPFALDPGQQAAKALWNGVSEFQLAWPFMPLHLGELDEFVDRWLGWFADAAQGKLQHPSAMPERETQGSMRTR